jgi:hypothetical protein
MRKRARWLALGISMVMVASVLSATTAGGGQSTNGEKPRATDVGITAEEIHIAVVADVDNPIVPNIFKPVKDAVIGIGKYLNSKAGGGGLAGRKVVVDFYDSKLSANGATNALIDACENDVAMVGTSAALLSSIDNMRNCKDATGATTGIPDIPFISTLTAHQCSDQSFPIQPPTLDCTTKDQHPQTWRSNVARARFFQKKFGKLHGVYVFVGDQKQTRDTQFASTGALRKVGLKSDEDFDRSALSQQSEFTPVVQAIKEHGSNYVQATTVTQMVALRKEAALQGVTGVKVWDCATSCYSKEFLETGGEDVEGTYVSIGFMPYFSKADLKANKAAAAYVKYTGKNNVGTYGAFAWAAGLAFRDAVNSAVKEHGINGVTRKTIFEALNKIHKFDADGFFGPFDLAGRQLGKCGVITQVKDGKFVRVRPKKPGTFFCDPDAILEHKLDLLNT